MQSIKKIKIVAFTGKYCGVKLAEFLPTELKTFTKG
jgi:hypothetical protein